MGQRGERQEENFKEQDFKVKNWDGLAYEEGGNIPGREQSLRVPEAGTREISQERGRPRGGPARTQAWYR